MGERVRVVRHGERLVAAKEAGPDGGDALRAEAEALHRVQGPGVVELVGLRGGEPPALLTAWVGPRSLAEVGTALPPRQAAAICLAVAAALGRLHRSGVVHAAVEPAHVLLDAHGRPVLCGFGSSGPIGAPVRRPATDRSGPTPEDTGTPPVLRPALDVAGVGELLAHLLGDRSPSGLGRAARRSAREWRSLMGVADHARLEDAGARPSLAAFSRGVRRAAPEACLVDGDDAAVPAPPRTPSEPRRSVAGRGRPDRQVPRTSGSPGSGAQARPRRRAPVLAALLGLVAVAATSYFGLSAWWSPSPGGASASATRREAAAPPATTTTSRPSTTTTSTSSTTPSGAGPGATGTADAVVVEHDGRRYGVGAAGDVVLVGPWRCDGRPLAAVLRPDDGSIHLFDTWAEPDAELAARQVGLVPGATRLEQAADGPGCAALVVGDDTETLATLTAEDLL